MAIFFCTAKQEYESHIHGDVPVSLVNDIVSVQADGHELEYIKLNFANIPMIHSRRTVCWFGDDAKFILMNIRGWK